MLLAVFLNVVSCISAGLAAWFWRKAATASVSPEQAEAAERFEVTLSRDPNAGDWASASVLPKDDKGKFYSLAETLALQGRWNTRAALSACVAAVGQALVYLHGLITALSAT
ncbi:hypothetical protein [Achromobacter sp. DH1f]|uniref:hypothetical protein n=1 Tax=Achromobacter sp. DH1f TaxID=1397275 RepID=UPI000468E1DA|nr:hypothetical protein [Achromobacter sp. DH1f]